MSCGAPQSAFTRERAARGECMVSPGKSGCCQPSSPRNRACTFPCTRLEPRTPGYVAMYPFTGQRRRLPDTRIRETFQPASIPMSSHVLAWPLSFQEMTVSMTTQPTHRSCFPSRVRGSRPLNCQSQILIRAASEFNGIIHRPTHRSGGHIPTIAPIMRTPDVIMMGNGN